MQHFDVAIIGSGTGNSLIDHRFDDSSVALIERNETFGGTCLNWGCIPTKMFVAPARHAASPREARRLGVDLQRAGVDWKGIQDRIFGRIDGIAADGREWRQQARNVELFAGEASFVDAHRLRVGDQELTADQFVIATGSRPRELEIEIPEELHSRVHTSDTIMRIPDQPKRLVILGGGYVSLEFASIFASLGTEVTIVHRSGELLRGMDREVVARLGSVLSERVSVRYHQSLESVEAGPGDSLQLVTTDRNGVEYFYFADALLVAIGRERNTEALNLPAAGVHMGDAGQIVVDEYQRTSAPHIYALGDAAGDWMLKHVANAEMRTVQHNLLHPGDLRATDHRYVPCAVFTDPELASVGATEEQLNEWGVRYVVARQLYKDVAYGWALEADERYFVKLLADPVSWQLLGAHIVGPQAATLIQPLIQAMSLGQRVPELARGQYWIHPAPTEVVENALLGLLEAVPQPALEA